MISLFIHEMSRVYMINRCEIKVDSVRVGIGPSLFKFKQQDIPLTIHLTSCEGFTW
ncbi:site-2 protease family protein [Turicibacter bilis]|nr:site-2 protease family protein [Turicibacter bilis]